jgi:hypothetical protein
LLRLVSLDTPGPTPDIRPNLIRVQTRIQIRVPHCFFRRHESELDKPVGTTGLLPSHVIEGIEAMRLSSDPHPVVGHVE